MDKDKVMALSRLARVEISEEEAENLSNEFEGILSYVSQVKEVSENKTMDSEMVELRNILREDSNPHVSGIYTESILNEAPSREGQYIKVKKIL